MVSTLSRALWREIRRRPAQFLSVALVIALGVGMFNASFDAYLNLTRSYEQLYRETGFAHVTAIGGPTGAVLAAGADMSELQASSSRIVADVPFQPRDGHTLIGRVVGMPASGHAPVNDIRITEGGTLDAAVPDGVVVEQHMAAHFGLHVGGTFADLRAGGLARGRGPGRGRLAGVPVASEESPGDPRPAGRFRRRLRERCVRRVPGQGRSTNGGALPASRRRFDCGRRIRA